MTNYTHLGLTLVNLADVHVQMGKLKSAERESARAYQLLKSITSSKHHYCGVARRVQASVLVKMKDYKNAEVLLNEAESNLVRNLGDDHERVARCKLLRAEMLIEQGQKDAAKTNLEDAIRLFEKSLLPGHQNLKKAEGLLKSIR